MADVTSGAEPLRGKQREPQQFGRITVVGGGCYGSYYIRQLLRAERVSALCWTDLVVVDRDPQCRVATLSEQERPSHLRLETADWEEYFPRYLDELAGESETRDAVVPSPLMPHLLAQWIVIRARKRWPDRDVAIAPIERVATVPWERPGHDGTHYVSFAEWMCPINCIEPAKCPHTRETRDWSMPVAIRRYAAGQQSGAYVFRCLHRSHGVGMIDVGEVIAADRSIAREGRAGDLEFLVGTASHCHGALQRILVRSGLGN
jgi:hypothetical protein